MARPRKAREPDVAIIVPEWRNTTPGYVSPPERQASKEMYERLYELLNAGRTPAGNRPTGNGSEVPK